MTNFFYGKGDQEFGPVSARELKQLAAEGHLLPTDLVWQEGGAKKVKASQCRGLVFSSQATAPTVSPPLPPDSAPKPSKSPPPLASYSATTLSETEPVDVAAMSDGIPKSATSTDDSVPLSAKASSALASFIGNAKAAGQLIAKQAERTKLKTVSLPNAFNALGKDIFAKGHFREELKDAYVTLDGYATSIKQLKANTAARPKAENITGRAKAAAQAASDATQVKVLEAKVRHSLTDFGRLSFDRFGDQAGPPELVQQIVQNRTRIDELDEAISKLSESKPGQILTPKRLAIAGVATSLFLCVIIGYRLVPSGDERDVLDPEDQATAIRLAAYYSTNKNSSVPNESWSFDKSIDFAQPYGSGNVFLLSNNRFAYCANDFHLRLCDATNSKELTVVDNLSPPSYGGGDARHSDSAQCILWGTGLSPKDGAALYAWNYDSRKIQIRLQLQPPTDRHPFTTEGTFSPDQKFIATASEESGSFAPPPVRIWDTTTLKTVYETKGRRPVAFSPDGSLLAFGTKEQGCILWDYRAGKQVTLKRPNNSKYSHVSSLAFIPNTPLIAIISNESSHLIELWDSRTHALVAALESDRRNGKLKYLQELAVSHDGTCLITTEDNGGDVLVWHLPSGRIAVLEGAKDHITSVSISPDGNTIAAASNKKVIFWTRQPAGKGEFVFSDRSHQRYGDPVVANARGPNGEKIMVASEGDWFEHYYFDSNGTPARHGTSRVSRDGSRFWDNYDRDVLVSRSVFYGTNLKKTYERLKDGTYQIDELVDGLQVRSIVTIKDDHGVTTKTVRAPEVLTEVSDEFKAISNESKAEISNEYSASLDSFDSLALKLEKKAQTIGPTVFTKRAVAFANPEFNGKLKPVAAGSRADFIQACALIGLVGHHFPLSSSDPEFYQVQIRMNIERWTEVFGVPTIESDRYDRFIKMDYQRWSYRCTDGRVVLHGNIIDGSHYKDGKTILSSMRACFY